MLIADNHKEIVDIAEAIRLAIYNLKIEHQHSYDYPYISVSCGLKICHDCDKLDLNNILVITDKALYQAKADGRNKIFIALDCSGGSVKI